MNQEEEMILVAIEHTKHWSEEKRHGFFKAMYESRAKVGGMGAAIFYNLLRKHKIELLLDA